MSLFQKIFSKKTKEEKVLPWVYLTSEMQLEEIDSQSFNKAQIIFKHSTRCSISSVAINRFTQSYNLEIDLADIYYLDLLNYRSVSNAVAQAFNVLHKSPQLIVIKNGAVIYHESHYGVEIEDFKSLI